MFDDTDPVAEARNVITSCGHILEPDDDFEHWRVDGGNWFNVGELLALAICLGLNAGVGRMQ